MNELISFFLALSLVIFPGLFLTRYFRPSSFLERVTIGILLSMVGVGSLVYLAGFVYPLLPSQTVWIGLLAMLGIIFDWKKYFPKKSEIPPFPRSAVSIFSILLFGITFVMAANIIFSSPDYSYDAVSYHLPFENEIAEKGSVAFYENPQNSYEVRSNYFPKLYESLRGTVRGISEPAANIIPLLVLAVSLAFFVLIGRHLCISMGGGALLYVLSLQVLFQIPTAYTDVFLGMLALGACYLLLVIHKEYSPIHALLLGLVAGAMVGTKGTGLLFAIPILVIFVWKFRSSVLNHFPTLFPAFLLGGGFYLLTFMMRPSISSFKLAAGNATLVAYPIIDGIIRNAGATLSIFFWMGILNQLSPLLLVGFVISFKVVKSMEEKMVGWLALGLLITVLGVSLVTISTARPDALPRFLIPFMAIAAILTNLCIARYTHLFSKPFTQRMARGLFVMLLLFTSSFSLYFMARYTVAQDNGQTVGQQIMQDLGKTFPNNPKTTVYVTNTPNYIRLGLEKATVRDYSSYTAPTIPACDFLREEGIRYVLFHFPKNPRPEFGAFDMALMQELNNGFCGQLDHQTPWYSVYTLS
jgi:hypothetical protein